MRERTLQEYTCPAENQCACPRCEWIRVKDKDGAWKDISGSQTCEKGTETSDGPCIFQPNRISDNEMDFSRVSSAQSPLARSRPTPQEFLKVIPGHIKGKHNLNRYIHKSSESSTVGPLKISLR